MKTELQRRYPIGAERQSGGGVHFRVWAPDCPYLDLILENQAGPFQNFPMTREEKGYFSLFVPDAQSGCLYRFRKKDKNQTVLLPDPASRFQPQGPLGPSQVVDPETYKWRNHSWKGLTIHGQILYELHVGTFTPEGTWKAAKEYLKELKELGVTCLEMMPVAEFPGRFGWGYDGVDLFAPYHGYGTPDDLKRFVDEAHHLGLGVILDVVYNHLGPSGNFLKFFSLQYFTDRYPNEWGEAINFDGPDSLQVREFFLTNACYWIQEFHFDGLRIDATQSIYDSSEIPILQEMSKACRDMAAPRSLLLIAENEPQEIKTIERISSKGFGLDAMWNDDFHHSWRVALTGKREAYYGDYRGTVEELVSLLQWGLLYQGQFNQRQKKKRGSPALQTPLEHFVVYLQNHDQVANSARGERLHHLTTMGRFKTASMALLLLPATPMIFQGQEFAASAPFLYFADHEPKLASLVAKGRWEFLTQFPSLKGRGNDYPLSAPHLFSTFEKCKLDWRERHTHAPIFKLYQDLLHWRKSDEVLNQTERAKFLMCTLGSAALAIRICTEKDQDRLIVLNLGPDLPPSEVHPNPLLVPPLHQKWELLLSTESPFYDGCGVPLPDENDDWCYMAHSGYFFRSVPCLFPARAK